MRKRVLVASARSSHQTAEAVDVGVVERRVDLVQHADRRRIRQEHGEQQGHGGQRLLAAGQERHDLETLARGARHDFEPGLQGIVRLGECQVCPAAAEQLHEEFREVPIDLLEGAQEARAGLLVQAGDALAQARDGGNQVGPLGVQGIDLLPDFLGFGCSASRLTAPMFSRSRTRRASLASTSSSAGRSWLGSISATSANWSSWHSRRSRTRSRNSVKAWSACSLAPSERTRSSRAWARLCSALLSALSASARRLSATARASVAALRSPSAVSIRSARLLRRRSISAGRASRLSISALVSRRRSASSLRCCAASAARRSHSAASSPIATRRCWRDSRSRSSRATSA